MKVSFFLGFLCLISFHISAQDISALNDDFSDTSSLKKWSILHQVEKWPNKLNTLKIEDGKLILEPRTSGWFQDGNAPFVYKTVNGDFDVKARVKSSGISSDIATSLWSLGGLMVRTPRKETAENWSPGRENWIFITTGVAATENKQVIETKYTINSRSNLKLRDARAEWITLRIVRVGHAFIMLYKYDTDKAWTVHERFYLQQWPNQLQIGFNCYTSSPNVPANDQDEISFNKTLHPNEGPLNMRLAIDYISFKRPAISYSGNSPYENWYNNVYKNHLTDYNVSNAEILKLLGE